MAEIFDLDPTDANNTGRFPEGQAPSTVNNGARALEGIIARGLRDTIIPDKTSGGSANEQTLTTNQSISAYAAGFSSFVFKAGYTNTGSCTLNVDSVGAVTIKTLNGNDLAAGAITAGGYYWVVYDGTNFILLNSGFVLQTGSTMTGALTMSSANINGSKGSDVASASTINLNTTSGNYVHVTGTTTINTITLNAGVWKQVVFDGALTLTNSSNLVLDGANITTAAGDTALFIGDGSSVTKLAAYKRKDGRNSAQLNSLQLEVSSGVFQLKPTTRIEVLEIEGSTPGIKVGQVSNPTTSDAFIRSTGGGASKGAIATYQNSSSSRPHIYFDNTNGNVGSISTSGSATAYNTSSDYRLKNIKGLVSDAWESVRNLKVYRFAWKADPDGPVVDGFLAHEVQEIVPEAVTGEKDAEVEIGTLTIDGKTETTEQPDVLPEGATWEKTGTRPVYQGIDQSKLVPRLTAVVQEAMVRIEELERQVRGA